MTPRVTPATTGVIPYYNKDQFSVFMEVELFGRLPHNVNLAIETTVSAVTIVEITMKMPRHIGIQLNLIGI